MRGNNLRQVPWTTTDSNFIHYKWKGEHAMNFKKVASIALAGAMAMSMMAVPAFADGTDATTTPTPTPIPTNTGKAYDVNVQNHTYNAYQIFTGTQADKNQPLGNVDWGTGVDSTGLLNALKKNPISGLDFSTCASAENTAQAVADVLATGNNGQQASDAQAREFAKIAYAHKTTTSIALGKESTNDITRTTNGNTVTYSGDGIKTGYYLIEDTTDVTPGTDGKEDAKNLTVLQVAHTITIKSKAQYPTIEKKILDPDEKDVNEASMGEDVQYELKSTVPDTKACPICSRKASHWTRTLSLLRSAIRLWLRTRITRSQLSIVRIWRIQSTTLQQMLTGRQHLRSTSMISRNTRPDRQSRLLTKLS